VSNSITQSNLNDAFKSLETNGMVLVGNTNQYTAVKLSNDEVEKVMAVHDLINGYANVFTYSKDQLQWFPTKFVGDVEINVSP
jgi:hypothetical protein